MEAKRELVKSKSGQIKDMLKAPELAEALQRALPEHITVGRMVQVALTALNQNPELLECDNKSFVRALIQTSILALEPDTPLGQSYFVPFKKKVQLIVGYRGLISLAYRSGLIDSICAFPVYEGDKFHIQKGTKPMIEHFENIEGPRGKVRGYYSSIYLRGSRHPIIDYMTQEEVDKIKARSASAKSPYSPWNTDPIEMGRKSVLKRNIKYAPANIESLTFQAIAIDTEADIGRTQRIRAEGFEVLNEDDEQTSKADEIKKNLGIEDDDEGDEGTAGPVEEKTT